MTGARGVLAAVDDKLGADWKIARGGVAEMVHFIDQLQYYILFEVIEAGWEGLQKSIRKPDATLDTLIGAHTSYLRSITRKGLLGGGSGSIDFTSQLHELLKLMLAYRDTVDGLYSHSVAEFTKRQELMSKIETRTREGRWGLTDADDAAPASASLLQSNAAARNLLSKEAAESSFPPPLIPLPGMASSSSSDSTAMLEQLRQRLKTLRADFQTKVNTLLGDLAHQPDTDMRFLGVVMNFNDVYAPVRRRKAGATAVGTGQQERDKEKVTAGASAGASTTGARSDERGRAVEGKR